MRFRWFSATAFPWLSQNGVWMHTKHSGAVPSGMHIAPLRPQMEHVVFAIVATDTRLRNHLARAPRLLRANFPIATMAAAD